MHEEPEEDLLAPSGIPGPAIAAQGREVLLRVLCQPPTPPTPQLLDRWLDIYATVLAICERGAELSWEELARRLSLQFYGRDRWEQLPLGPRLAWEAAARTMVNWCLVEDNDDRRDMESFDWEQWALERMEKMS